MTYLRMLVVALLLTGVASGQDHPARPDDTGVLTSEAMGIIQKSISVGWTKEQVSFLAGTPEHTQTFSNGFDVWRYRTSSEFLLVAFREDKVVEVSRRPIPEKALKATAERAMNEAASEPPSQAPTTAPTPPHPSYYSEIGTVYGIRLGTNEPQVREQLARQGIHFGSDPKDLASVTCETARGEHACNISPLAAPTWELGSEPVQVITLGFDRDGKLIWIRQLVVSDDADVIQASYNHYAAILGAAFKTPSKHALGDYGRVRAWATRTLLGSFGNGKLTSSEGWSSGGVTADMLLYESKTSPFHQLYIIHGLPEFF
jgi:hypothetical protein